MEIGRKFSVPNFAKGIHVLVVDHDKNSLQSIASMLQTCSFKVTSSDEADAAFRAIMEEKDEPFNLVMATATVSNMKALSFLHQTAIPIILMSSPETDMKAAGKAIADWGCHFLEKPISIEDIELVWQLVYRKIRNPRAKNSGEISNQAKKSEIGGMFGRIVNVARGVEWKSIEEEEKVKNGGKCVGLKSSVFDYLETSKMANAEEKKNGANKRSRIVWSSKLHRKFTEALSKLGNKKSSPKIILKMMNEPSLTLRQVASHLQKFKSQVKHLNKITASDASTSLSRNNQQVQQQLPVKCNINITNILGQPSYNSNNIITDNPRRQLQVVPSCFNNNAPRLPSRDLVANCRLRTTTMMNQNNSSSYKTPQPNDDHVQPKTYGGGFEGTNPVEDDRIFTDVNESTNSEGFVQLQTSHSNFQYFGAADHDDLYPFLSPDNHYMNAVEDQLEFGCLDVDKITSGARSVTAGSLNQNVALKELDDLLNDFEDPMVYRCYDGDMNSFDIDEFSEWLNA